jgi:enamine deaminase RidA (YjgF/YER057c/UK114 family)
MKVKKMEEIKRIEIDEVWADSCIVEAGDYVFIGYCMKNEGQSIKNQINGAFEVLEKRLETVGLTLESVVKMDCLFKDIKDLQFLAEIIKNKFHGKYPARKAFETKFIRDGIDFQIDAIAFKGKNKNR